VQCCNQLHHRIPYERIVIIPTTRVSKTLFGGGASIIRGYSLFCEGSWINPCKKRGMSVYVWCCGLVTVRSVRTWNVQNGKSYFSGIASKVETSKSEAAPKPLLQHTQLPLRVQCSCHYERRTVLRCIKNIYEKHTQRNGNWFQASAEICALFGCYSAYSGNSLPMFRANLAVSSSKVNYTKKKDFSGLLSLEDGTDGFPETSVRITTLLCVIPHKSADSIKNENA